MRMEGNRDFTLPLADVWARLSDAAFLGSCLEGVELVRSEPDVAVWRMHPRLAFMSGRLDATLTITERLPPTEMRATVLSKGIGATSTVATHLTFAPHGAGTRVHWEMEIAQLTGLLKLLPSGLVQATAGKVIEDVWEMIEKKMQ